MRNVIGFISEPREKKGLTTLLGIDTKINESQPTVLLIVGVVHAGEDYLMSCTRLYQIRKSVLQDMCQIMTLLRIIQ